MLPWSKSIKPSFNVERLWKALLSAYATSLIPSLDKQLQAPEPNLGLGPRQ